MGNRFAFVTALVLGGASTILGAPWSLASPITYTEQATAFGSLGGISFADESIVLTMHNDTANVAGTPPRLFNDGTATVSVAGGMPVSFTDPIEVFSNQTAPLGPQQLALKISRRVWIYWTSPGRSWSSMRCSSGRSQRPPEAASSKIRRQPAARRASACTALLCSSPLETRA